MDAIETAPLPPTVSEFVSRYEDRVGGRDEFLWKWIHYLFPAFELSSVADAERDSVRVAKTALTIFVTVLDDLVEERGDAATFDEARFIPFDATRVRHERDGVDGDVVGYLTDLWMELDSRLRDAVRYDEFEELFRYDLRQTIDAIRYGDTMSRHPSASNETGYFRQASHNMCMFPYSDIDAMHSPALRRSDVGTVRSVLWDLQELARIGNDVTTWEREVDEGDFSSVVVARAVRDGVVTARELREEVDAASVKARIRRAGIEERLVERWEERFRAIRSEAERASTDSVDVEALIEGMRTVFEYHLASRGRK